jgi:hypothetical protein
MQNGNGYFWPYMQVLHFLNGLMELIIENDVGIICLKCVDCFKSLQVM